jgi:hypothetical protein
MSVRPSSHAHWRIRDMAISMGHELYDQLMQDNNLNNQWKSRFPNLNSEQRETMFVQQNMSRLLPQARAMLTGMLNNCEDDSLRDAIYEALILDATLVRGRAQ